jgi:uncharacterized protein YacL
MAGLRGAARAVALAAAGLVWRRPARAEAARPPVILDTSVIIDGRVLGVCEAGFVEGRVLVPAFVLRELRQIAESPDGLRKSRARRGLEVLERLGRVPGVAVEVDARDFPALGRVDDKLLALARATGGRLMTNDVELGRRAADGGVTALSLNALAQALRPVALPGEPLAVRVVKEGRQAGQGVAYLDDGTMVVVEEGRRLVGRTVDVTVTTTLQTGAGRLIFARPRGGEAAPR